MTRALIIRHHEAETMGDNFRAILEKRQFELIACNIFESAPEYDRFDAPPLDEVDLIMAFGGPMSVNDDLPALHLERPYLAQAMGEGKPVFGVCLGAQMMSTALGRCRRAQRRVPVRAAQDSHHNRRRCRSGLRTYCLAHRSDAARRMLHRTPRGNQAGRGRHPAPRRALSPHQHGLPIWRLLCLPV